MPFEPPNPADPDSRPPAGGLPPVLTESTHQPSSGRQFLASVLSLYLGIFLADAVLSLADDTLMVFFGMHSLSIARGLVSAFALLMAVLIYVLMALTPMVPKRLFLPLTLFNLAAMLASIPLLIYFFSRVQLIGWGISFCQVVLGLGILYRAVGGIRLRWPLVAVGELDHRRFSWGNLIGFVLMNLFVLLPAVIAYLLGNTALAVDHFSEGFVALRPAGISVEVRKYVRKDGKVIELFPMAHVADAGFYRKVSQTFPTNSLILMEGVTDNGNLLTNKISYARMARSLGLAEQHEAFAPRRGTMVRADVDIGQFSKETIGFLNLAMLFHAKGLNPAVLVQLMKVSPTPGLEEQLIGDLLTRRNQHLLEEIQVHLPESDSLMVPWGAAHMPGIAREIIKSGFHLDETREYMVIRFRGTENPGPESRP